MPEPDQSIDSARRAAYDATKGAGRLRIALLSLMDSVPGDPPGLRGMLSIGGHSILRHQLGLVLALGCARIIVMAETLNGDLVALQHIAEARGARFHVIAAPRALAPLVAPEDELFVLAEGLLAMPEDALRLLDEGHCVLTLPIETGLAAGFERIDINSAYAGAMCLPGRLVAGLGDLPADWNPSSALLRLAMQARILQRSLAAALLDEGRWILVRSETEAHRAEPGWVRVHIKAGEVQSLGAWIAAMAVQRFGPTLLHAGTRPEVIGLAALVTALFGIGAGWFGWHTAGFGMIGFAWLLQQGAGLLWHVEVSSLLARPGRKNFAGFAVWGIDAALMTLCAWRSDLPALVQFPLGTGWFTPVVLLLALRLLQEVLPQRRWLMWLGDRLILALLLGGISALLPFDAALQVMVVGVLIAGLATARRDSARSNAELTTQG